MKYHFKIHKESVGYWAECIELKGCSTQANSRKELDQNMKDALELYLSEPEDSKVIFPPPKEMRKQANVVAVSVDPGVAFAMNVRNLRLRHGYTQKQIADKMAYPNIYSYQRLEAGDTNPTLQTLVMLKKVYGDELDVNQILEGDVD